MKTFKIIRPDENIRPALIDKINNLTKPKGSLGTLEELDRKSTRLNSSHPSSSRMPSSA